MCPLCKIRSMFSRKPKGKLIRTTIYGKHGFSVAEGLQTTVFVKVDGACGGSGGGSGR